MSDDYDGNVEKTINLGEEALSYIKRNSLSAVPRNYELWYTYSAGFNWSLNKTIDAIVAEHGYISAEQLQDLYVRFLAPYRVGERIDELGSRLNQQVGTVARALATHQGVCSGYHTSLQHALSNLSKMETSDPTALRNVITKLMAYTEEALSSNDRLSNALTASTSEVATVHENLAAIRYESLTDELTTLCNRRHFDVSLTRALAAAQDELEPFCLLLTDIDHFKTFNDTYGHQTGDQVLRLVAQAVKQHLHSDDIACRYGGEEFAVIVPQADLAGASNLAELIRKAVLSKQLIKRSTGEHLGRVTISIGVAEYRAGDTSQSIISRADIALYQAKHAGRNVVRNECDLDTFGQALGNPSGEVDDEKINPQVA